MSCNTIYHTPGGGAPRSAGMWWDPLDIIPQISILRALYDPKNVQIHLDTILKQKDYVETRVAQIAASWHPDC